MARRVTLTIVAFLPAAYVIYLIALYGVNVPYADEFTLAPLLVKAHQHTLTFSDLFAQHNEHRYFFSRLFFIAIGFLARGDVRAEMYFSVLLTLLVSGTLWLLLRKTVPLSLEQRLLVLFSFNLLLFSPVQAENWTWGFQFPLFFCNFLFTCGLLAACSSLSLARKFPLCAIIAFVATFSFGGGVLLWGLTFPVALLSQPETTWKSRAKWLAGWCGVMIGSIGLYFFHYVKPPYHPPLAASGNPADYFIYVAGFLGAHLSRATGLGAIGQAVLVGTVLLGLFFGSVAYAFSRRSDVGLVNRILPWVAVGGYALFSGLLAAAARIGFGVNQALDSRYTSFSLYLSLAAIALCLIVRQDLHRRGVTPRMERLIVRGETVVITGFAILSLIAFGWGRSSMAASEQARLWGKGALLFTNVIDTGEIHDRCLIANAPEARAFANQLDSIGLLHPRMLTTAEIGKLETRPKQAGFLDIMSTTGQACSATGWAIIPKTQRPAHCVVLSYQDAARGEVAFRVADQIYDRLDVAASLKSDAATASGWICHFDRSAVPPGDHMVSAWAFDANRGILYPLGTPKLLH